MRPRDPGRLFAQDFGGWTVGRDFRVRLICPEWDYDKWVTKEDLDLTLEEVLNTFWDFRCPTHGAQHEKPFQAHEKKWPPDSERH